MCLHPIYPTETGADTPRKTVGRALLLWSCVRRGVVDNLPFPGFRILRQVEVLLHAAVVHTCFCVVVRHIVFCTPSPCRPHARRTAERHPAPPQAFNVPVLLIVPWQQTKIRPPPAPPLQSIVPAMVRSPPTSRIKRSHRRRQLSVSPA